ncbi:MAG: hypothetical protein SGPRY_007813 [Prymnesium sp.]
MAAVGSLALLLAFTPPPLLPSALPTLPAPPSSPPNHPLLRPSFRLRIVAVMSMPSDVLSLLPAAVRRSPESSSAAKANWEALLACYTSEKDAIAAATLCPALLLPYGFDANNRASNIAGSYEVLQELLPDETTLRDVLSKNPGVLGCTPKGLRSSNSADITRAASFASFFTSALGPARNFLTSKSWWDEGAAEGDEEELELPTLEVDGITYLYDEEGEYNGVEHLLLTEAGEAWGVWDPATSTAEECIFEEEEE